MLIIGSGDIVHNLRLANFGEQQPYDWAERFDTLVLRQLREGDNQALVDYQRSPDGRLAVPTPDHYLPLLYVAGLRQTGEALSLLAEGIEFGSVSMTAFRLG